MRKCGCRLGRLRDFPKLDIKKLRESVEHGACLPHGWYVYVFPDGSRSHELTGENVPTGPHDPIGTVGGGQCNERRIKEKEKELLENYKEDAYRDRQYRKKVPGW